MGGGVRLGMRIISGELYKQLSGALLSGHGRSVWAVLEDRIRMEVHDCGLIPGGMELGIF